MDHTDPRTDAVAQQNNGSGHDIQLQLRAVFNKTRDAILLANDTGRYVEANPAAERILGYTRSELLNLSVPDVVERTVSVNDGTLWDEFMNDGQQTGVIELKRKDGASVVCQYNATANILPGLHLSILTDVTEQRKAENKLRESEQRFRAIIENSADVIFLSNADGVIRYTTPSVKRVLGYDESEVLGKSGKDFLHPENLKVREERRRQLLEAPQRLFTDTARMRHKDGSWRWVEYTVTNLLEQEPVNAIVTTFRDVTEREEADTRLRKAREQLRLAHDVADIGIWNHDLATDVFRVDERARAHYGFDTDTLPFADVFKRLHPDDVERLGAEFAAATAPTADGSFSTEYRVLHPDGSTRWLGIGVRVWFEGEGPARKAAIGFGTTHDITARKNTEEKLRFLVELNQDLTPLSDPEAIMAVTARRLGRYLRVNRCAYAEVAENEDDFRIIGDYTDGTFSIVGSFRMSAFGAEVHRLMLANEPYVVHDVSSNPVTEGYLDAYRQTDIASVICLPLHKAGKFVAAMAVHQKTPRRWTHEEIELVQLVVSRCWEALERARTANELRQSEAKYRSLFTSIDEGFCVVEMVFDENSRPLDYRFVDTNPMFENQTGLENAKGKTARELLPDLEQSWFDRYGEVALTGKAVRFTESSHVMNRWFDVNAFRVGEPESRQVAILFSDITERRRIEQQLVESEARFRALADDAPVMIWQADEEARITYANRTYLDFVGLDTVEEFRGLSWQTVTHPDDVQRIYDSYRDAAAARLPYEFEHRVKEARSGEYRYLHVQGKPRFTATGDFIGYLGVVTDVTERKEFVRELEQRVQERTRQLQESNAHLERSNAELEQFAYIASHDLQEPLRKIKTFADRLSRDAVFEQNETGARYLEKIIGSAERMHTLIHGVLEYSKLSHAYENFDSVDLNAVLSNVLVDFELTLDQTNAAVTFEKLPIVEAVALQMNQLFTNLVGNALKFTKPNEPPVLHVGCRLLSGLDALALGLDQNRAYFDISVKDNGIGFSEQYADQIFVIFQRLHGRHLYGGTGIGLALCRRIVNNHQGVIYARSRENEGAEFHVVLPTHIDRAEPFKA